MFATLALLASTAPCGSALFMPYLPPPRPSGPHAFGAALGSRDSYGVTNFVENERIIVRFGPTNADPVDADSLLQNIDRAWAIEVDQLGYPAPAFSDQFKFNVYIGDSGGGAPDGLGNSGYFNVDPEGYPMLVVAAETVANDDFRPWVAAHELHHALQFSFDVYTYDGEGAWFFEASAEWAAGVVVPGNSYNASSLGPYAMLSYLGVSFFDYPDEGTLQENHQYGAAIFPRYVTEKITGDAAMLRVWTDPDPDNEPLLAIFRELGAAGRDPERAFADYAATNVTWDYLAHDIYAYWADAWIEFYPDEDATVVGSIPLMDGDHPEDAPVDTLPERFAYNLMTRVVDEDGSWRFIVDGDDVVARVVVETEAHDVSVEPVDGPTDIDLVAGDTATLVVAAIGFTADPRTRFPYRAGMRRVGDGPGSDAPAEDGPFGCGAGAGALPLALAALGVRRRRRGRR